METKTFTVNGMACDHCKANVEKAIINIDGVLSAKVCLADKCVTVEYDAKRVSPEEMQKNVCKLGYDFIV